MYLFAPLRAKEEKRMRLESDRNEAEKKAERQRIKEEIKIKNARASDFSASWTEHY